MKAEVANYTLVCLVSVVLLLFALLQQGLWPWAMLPCTVAGLAIALRWRTGSGLFLMSLGGIFLRNRLAEGYVTVAAFHPAILLVCGSALSFVIANTRLLSLTRNILSLDPRRDEWFHMMVAQTGKAEIPRQAPLERVHSNDSAGGELTWLLISLPIWVVIGQVVWQWLSQRSPEIPVLPDVWRLVLLGIVCSLAILTAHVAFAIWHYATMSKSEAHMVLQETQWLDMRKEQRLMSRWLAWQRWRRSRGDEQ